MEDGITAYQKNDYGTAYSLLRPQAEQEDALAQYWLGVMYANGQGVPTDMNEAMNWWHRAGSQGNPLAQSNLCFTYLRERDFDQGAKWCRLAAAQGDKRAQLNAGLIYFRGEGIQEDYAEAAKRFRLAAEQGVGQAQTILGVLYANGQGVAQSYVEAIRWFRLAADQGDAEAQSRQEFCGFRRRWR